MYQQSLAGFNDPTQDYALLHYLRSGHFWDLSDGIEIERVRSLAESFKLSRDYTTRGIWKLMVLLRNGWREVPAIVDRTKLAAQYHMILRHASS